MLNTVSEASMLNTLAVMKINDVTETIRSKNRSISVIHLRINCCLIFLIQSLKLAENCHFQFMWDYLLLVGQEIEQIIFSL